MPRCHLLLRESSLTTDEQDLTLVDLHRAQLRPRVPERWRVKDIGGLLFSSLNIGFSQRDYLRFLKTYFATDVRSILREHESLLQKIRQRARSTYRRDFGHWPTI